MKGERKTLSLRKKKRKKKNRSAVCRGEKSGKRCLVEVRRRRPVWLGSSRSRKEKESVSSKEEGYSPAQVIKKTRRYARHAGPGFKSKGGGIKEEATFL